MYVATRELELKTRKAKPGDSVPEVLDWSYPVLLAHLNMGWIKYVGDGADAHPDDRQSSSSTTQQAATTQAPPKEPKSRKKPEEKKAPPVEGDFKCDQCGKSFKTERALKIHVTTAHKK